MKTLIDRTESVSFFGRPYRELLSCFGLSQRDLAGTKVLECPSGPSSFVAEACRDGINAVGLDPLFYRSPEALRRLAYADFEEMFHRIRRNPDRFVNNTYQSLDQAEIIRRQALDTFLEDYGKSFASGRYLCGSLPRLDLADCSYDLVLCGHLLFTYADRFDLAFHCRAVSEMCRVAKREVRIHPIIDGRHQRCPFLDRLEDCAMKHGFSARIQAVNHEFFKGATETLVLQRR